MAGWLVGQLCRTADKRGKEKRERCRYTRVRERYFRRGITSFSGNYSAQARRDFFAYHTPSRGKDVLYAKSRNKMKHHPAGRKDGQEECCEQEYEIMKVCHRLRGPVIICEMRRARGNLDENLPARSTPLAYSAFASRPVDLPSIFPGRVCLDITRVKRRGDRDK